MLTDLPSLKASLRIFNDVSQDQYLSTLIFIADRAVKLHVKQELETQPYIEYQDGSGSQFLTTMQRPVWGIQNIWLDPGGLGGQAPNSFAANSALNPGVDFYLKIDNSKYYRSDSGIIYRMGGGLISTIAYMPWNWRRGSLTAKLAPPWPAGWGNIKIAYTAGYGLGAGDPPNGTLPPGTTLPMDLTHAANMVCAWLRATVPVGTAIDVESNAESANAIMEGAMKGGDAPPQLASAVGILRHYRELAI